MKKYWIIFLIIILFVLFMISLVSNPNQVCINNHCFLVEMAKTREERSQGLMNRKYLAENKGMLFVFDNEDIHSFWMKDVLIPLDIVWINQDKEVVYIYRNAQPCKEECESIRPEKKAMYVLEINAGQADFKVGDKAVFE